MLLRSTEGASAAEYALILAIVGAAIALAAFTLGGAISDSLYSSSEKVANCAGAC